MATPDISLPGSNSSEQTAAVAQGGWVNQRSKHLDVVGTFSYPAGSAAVLVNIRQMDVYSRFMRREESK